MGADNHSTTKVDVPDDEYEVRRLRLKRALKPLDCVRSTRAGLFAKSCVIVDTDGEPLSSEALRVLADHGASVGANKEPHDPFEVFL